MNKQKARLSILSLGFIISLFFIACGSDSDKSSEPATVTKVESFDDLVHCTKSHYGEVVQVTDLDSIYECTDSGWVALDSSKVEEIIKSSSSGATSSSSIKKDSSDVAEIEQKAVDSVTVKGFAQKGPFSEGSAITITSLDAKTFELSDEVFKGKTTGDSVGRSMIT